jgi:hypothetical protein
MGTAIFLVGSVIALIGMMVFVGIRLRIVSALQAAIVMTVVSGVSGVVMELSSNSSDSLGATCTGTLLAGIFGVWTFVFGRALEQWVSKQPK